MDACYSTYFDPAAFCGSTQDGASWSVDLEAPSLEPATLGLWWAEIVDAWLDDFAELVRAREARLVDDTGHTIAREPDESFAAFRRRLVDAIRTHPVRLSETTLTVDLHAWFRTAESPAEPIHGWITPTHLALYIHVDDDRSGYASFDLPVSLFTWTERNGRPASNLELYRRNHPALQRALERWASRVGQRLQVGGELPNRDENGFRPPDDDEL